MTLDDIHTSDHARLLNLRGRGRYVALWRPDETYPYSIHGNGLSPEQAREDVRKVRGSRMAGECLVVAVDSIEP